LCARRIEKVMFNIGDLIIYSSHGVCHIEDICEKKYMNITKKYYVMHPLNDKKLVINIPVDSSKVKIEDIIERDEAEEILEFFKMKGLNWIDLKNQRIDIYSEIIKTGNRREISKIDNTMICRKYEMEVKGKTFSEKDNKLLSITQNILFTELAIVLDTTYEEICEKVMNSIRSIEF
jgi:CarD family transcriptional regulator